MLAPRTDHDRRTRDRSAGARTAPAAGASARGAARLSRGLRRPGTVGIGGASLLVIALLGSIYTMHWARAVLVPLMLGLILAYALRPLVERLVRHAVPCPLAAAFVVAALVAAPAAGAWSLADETTQFIEALPQVAHRLREALRGERPATETPIDKVQQAATQLEQAARETAPPPAVGRGVTRVQIEKPAFVLKDYLLTMTPGLLTAVGQTMAVIFLTYFLLASGSRFRRKLVRLAGPRFERKRIALQALDEITAQIQRYLLVQCLIGAGVGVATWLALWALGLEHAVVWGVLAGVLNLVPYLGALVFTGAVALAAFLQFASLDMALLVAGLSALLHIVSGHAVTPWLTGRANRMNPVAVFVGLLGFGWIWGVWGLFLGVPVLLIVKAVCERVDALRGVGEILAA